MTVMVMTDTHCPFMHPDALDFLDSVANSAKPDEVVHDGDVADFHFASRYDKHSKNSAEEELDKAASQLKGLADRFRNVKVCYGNHDERLFKKLDSSSLPRKVLVGMNSILGLPETWLWSDRWVVDGVVYEHGHQFGGQDAHIRAARLNLQSTVIGHVHAHAGIQYVASTGLNIFGMNAGCLIDRNAYAFEYAKKQALPVIGCGLVIDGRPLFIPMPLNSGGRWNRNR